MATATLGRGAPAWTSAVAASWRRIARWGEALPLARMGQAAVAAGVMLRLLAPLLMDFRADGNTYVAMGHAWMQHRAFLMPWGDVTTWLPHEPAYSNHYPPAYPFYLGLVFALFGYGLWQAKLAAVAVSLAALGAVWWTTRDLYGRERAWLVAGLLALEPHLLWVTGTGFSENMVLLFFALTMWAILRSLDDDRFIVWAGLFAGLAYLSRASVGYFFVVAGLGGFLWRFHYRRWRLFTNVWYMLAIAVFGVVVVAWAWRNVHLFGWPHWDTSSYTRWVGTYASRNPDLWRHALAAKIPLFLAFLAHWAGPFGPELARSLRRLREEATSALWLSVGLVWVLAWIITAMFWTYEQSSLYWLDNHRYVVIGLLPLAWLVAREARWEKAAPRLRWALLATGLFALTAAVVLSPVRYADIRAAEALDGMLEPGDEIAVDGATIKYAFYAYLSRPQDVTIYGCARQPPDCAGGWGNPDFVVNLGWDRYDGYVVVGTFRESYWNDGTIVAQVWAREDVAAARGLSPS